MKMILVVLILLCIMYIYYRLKSIEWYSDSEPCDENWTEWSSCSKECSGGEQKRERDMQVQLINGKFCPHLVEKRPCNTQPCK
jgi:hypothetical protein